MSRRGEVFFGVKRAYAILFSCVVDLVDRLGSDEALGLLGKAVKRRGRADGMELVRRLGDVDDGLGGGLAVYGAFLRDSGIEFDVVERSADRVVLRVGRCPVFEACHEAVLDCGFFGERMCRWLFLPLASAVVGVVDARLRVGLVRYRHFHDGYCLEELVLERK